MPPSYFNDVIHGRPFGSGEGLECMQTAWYVLDIKMSDSLFPSSLSTPHCSAGVNRGISNSLGRNSCFITETVGGRVYRLDIKLLLFKIFLSRCTTNHIKNFGPRSKILCHAYHFLIGGQSCTHYEKKSTKLV